MSQYYRTFIICVTTGCLSGKLKMRLFQVFEQKFVYQAGSDGTFKKCTVCMGSSQMAMASVQKGIINHIQTSIRNTLIYEMIHTNARKKICI